MADEDSYKNNSRPRGAGILGRLFVSLIGTVLVVSIVANIYFALILGQLTGGISESVYQEGNAGSRIVILPISGTIDSTTATYVFQSLKELRENPPAALVLRVDSGGGAVGPSDQIWHMFEVFKKKHPDIPIVSSYGQVAASGAYYLSVGSDYIIAEPTTITGSIGVMAPIFTFAGLLKKIGVEPVWLHAKGSPYKLLGNDPTRTWNEKDKQEIRKLLNAAYKRFANIVYLGRSQSPAHATRAEIDLVDKGKIYTAKEAKKYKLIDSIGYLGDAIKKAEKLAKIPGDITPQVTLIHKPGSFSLFNLITGSRFTTSPKASLMNMNSDQLRSAIEQMLTPQREYRAMIR